MNVIDWRELVRAAIWAEVGSFVLWCVWPRPKKERAK
jgi:hypothetical protein